MELLLWTVFLYSVFSVIMVALSKRNYLVYDVRIALLEEEGVERKKLIDAGIEISDEWTFDSYDSYDKMLYGMKYMRYWSLDTLKAATVANRKIHTEWTVLK